MRKVLLVIDQKGWAFHFRALALQQHLADTHEIDIVEQREFASKPNAYREKYDHVHVMNWLLGRNVFDRSYSAAVCSHRFHLDFQPVARRILPKYQAVACVSERIRAIIEARGLSRRAYACPNGVDTDLFHPADSYPRGKFTVGFVGKRPVGRQRAREDIKGHVAVLEPLIKRFENHPRIEFLVNGNHAGNAVPRNEMPQFYQRMSALVCTSWLDGTPGSVMEAAACGIPIISTDVGVVRDVIGDQGGFIVPQYDPMNKASVAETIEVIARHIEYLAENREQAEDMGKWNRYAVIKSYRWSDRARAFIPVFA